MRVIRRQNARVGAVRAGFTIAEIALVILLIGVLLTIVAGMMFGLSNVVSQASPVSQQKGRAFLALENVRASIAMTFFNRDAERLIFYGTPGGSGELREDRLTFSCVHPNAEGMGAASVRDVSFYLARDESAEANPDAPFILYRREDQIADKDPGEGGQHYPILKNVASFRLRYTLNGVDWTEEWDSTKSRRIPRMAQIQLRVMIGERIEYFETVTQPGLYIR